MQSYQLYFFYLNTYVYRYAKISSPKVMKGLFLASDIGMSDPFICHFLPIFRFKLLVEYEDTCVTERYFVNCLGTNQRYVGYFSKSLHPPGSKFGLLS